MLELHKKVQPKMDLGVLIKFFYYGLFSLYQNALDIVVGETFSEYDAAKAYKILNGLSIFPVIDESGMITKLENIEKTLDELTLRTIH